MIEHLSNTEKQYFSDALSFLISATLFLLVPLARPLYGSLSKASLSKVLIILLSIILLYLITLSVAYLIKNHAESLKKLFRPRILIKASTTILVHPILLLLSLSTLTFALFLARSPLEHLHIPIYGIVGSYFFFRSHSYLSSRLSHLSYTQNLPISCILLSLASALLVAIFLSLADEGLQGFHPERFFDLQDLLLNGLSSATGVLLSLKYLFIRDSKRCNL